MSSIESPTAGDSASEGRRVRVRFTKEQVVVLEACFEADTHPSEQKLVSIASEIGEAQLSRVKTWFNNRRAKQRQKSKKSPEGGGSPTSTGGLANLSRAESAGLEPAVDSHPDLTARASQQLLKMQVTDFEGRPSPESLGTSAGSPKRQAEVAAGLPAPYQKRQAMIDSSDYCSKVQALANQADPFIEAGDPRAFDILRAVCVPFAEGIAGLKDSFGVVSRTAGELGSKFISALLLVDVLPMHRENLKDLCLYLNVQLKANNCVNGKFQQAAELAENPWDTPGVVKAMSGELIASPAGSFPWFEDPAVALHRLDVLQVKGLFKQASNLAHAYLYRGCTNLDPFLTAELQKHRQKALLQLGWFEDAMHEAKALGAEACWLLARELLLLGQALHAQAMALYAVQNWRVTPSHANDPAQGLQKPLATLVTAAAKAGLDQDVQSLVLQVLPCMNHVLQYQAVAQELHANGGGNGGPERPFLVRLALQTAAAGLLAAGQQLREQGTPVSAGKAASGLKQHCAFLCDWLLGVLEMCFPLLANRAALTAFSLQPTMERFHAVDSRFEGSPKIMHGPWSKTTEAGMPEAEALDEAMTQLGAPALPQQWGSGQPAWMALRATLMQECALSHESHEDRVAAFLRDGQHTRAIQEVQSLVGQDAALLPPTASVYGGRATHKVPGAAGLLVQQVCEACVDVQPEWTLHAAALTAAAMMKDLTPAGYDVLAQWVRLMAQACPNLPQGPLLLQNHLALVVDAWEVGREGKAASVVQKKLLLAIEEELGEDVAAGCAQVFRPQHAAAPASAAPMLSMPPAVSLPHATLDW